MIRKWVAVLWLAVVAMPALAADPIERVEPASWWVGMKDDRLQLLVHGTRIADLEPAVQYTGVVLDSVERVANPNYLFVNLQISPATRPGSFHISFRKGGKTVASHRYTLNAREPDSAVRQGFGPQDVIYLITPDRFANGNPGNDYVKGMPDPLNRAAPLGRHGGDLAGIARHLDYIAGMGFTQLWLNPVVENNQPEASYHGYAITDFYKIDARYGDNESYRRLVADARQRGIGVIKDVILNHCGASHWWMRDLPTGDWFNNGNTFKPTTHVREALQDPHAAQVDREVFADGWFVDTMPDMNQRNPFMAKYLIQNSIWWVEYAGLSGLRVDTWPYSDRTFLTEWARRLTEEYPNLGIVGEEWSGSPITVSYWQRGRQPADGYVSYLPSLFDFPLQEAVTVALLEKEDWGTGMRRIYRTLSYDGLYPDPDKLVVFPDNHDVSRIHTMLGQRAELTRMAVAFFLTTRGVPQIYYGTEILMHNPPGPKDDGLIRSDFPGGWPGDAKNAFTGEGLSADERAMQTYLRQLLQWRRTAPAIRDGKLTQYVPMGGVYVYFRHDAAQKVMVILNNNDAAQTVETQRFQEVIGSATAGTDVISGQPHVLASGIAVPAHSATILELH
ncbi:MAG: glycoside hydrolase family 13 protein [Proteobacteria bacterium]|nr:glycoside hydrolase family 13 protein [Pseudomonadota bacterium]MBP7607855.1 glycoside hydrolase family 13 protein [Steroidobacteraceae bacterium]